MIISASLRNSAGQTLSLTDDESVYQLTNIEGLESPNNNVNIATIGMLPGGRFNGARLDTRNIVLDVVINGEVETNRQALYKFCAGNITFFFQNENRNVFIDGYVDSMECNPFSQQETAQISIICPNPFFKYITQKSEIITNAQATSTLKNDGESPTGVEVEFEVTAAPTGLLGYISSLSLINTTTNEMLDLGGMQLVQGDKIIANTNEGEKSVKLIHNGTTSNGFQFLTSSSKFLTLASGNNAISYSVTGSNKNTVKTTVRWYDKYRGV